MNTGRIVFHIDMDAFFAAIEERNNPHFAGKPIVVGADPKAGRGRGVVSTANYEARKFGIRSAMPISEAWRRCPEAVFLPVDIERYQTVSRRISTILYSMIVPGMVMERASIDEFYLEARRISWADAEAFAQSLKKAIREKEHLTCSVGIGPNPLIAKIASDFKKPDGLTIVKQENVAQFLAPLSIRTIPGIGPKIEAVLVGRGIRTIAELRALSREELAALFGKWGEVIWERSRGVDETPVGIEEEAKSIGEQETFERDTTDRVFLTDRLMALCESVWHRMAHACMRPRTIVITIRFADFETKTRSRTVRGIVRSSTEFKREALALVLPFFDSRGNPQGKAVRLLGVRGKHLTKISNAHT